MNLLNKAIVGRIILTIIIVILLIFPFSATGFTMPQLFINEKIVIDVKYLIAGILFCVSILIDFIYKNLGKKISDFENLTDETTNAILINSVLIILSSQGFIHPIIPVVIIVRDVIIDSLRVMVGSQGKYLKINKLDKIKSFCLLFGIMLTLFYNLPFELFNLRVADFLLILAAVLSIISGVQYYNVNKNFLKEM